MKTLENGEVEVSNPGYSEELIDARFNNLNRKIGELKNVSARKRY
jgi:hypothetical protein